jgi:predicted peptidase
VHAGWRALAVAALAAVALGASAGTPESAAVQTGFLDRQLVVDGETYRYQVFVPADYTPSRRWPMLLFLHGSGERGDDGLKQTTVGLPSAIRYDRTRFPLVVVMPQARADARWYGANATQAMAALEAATLEFHGDRDRTYLSGLSMGGQGTWLLAAQHPGRFAAIAPVCGFLRLKHDDDVPDPAVDAALVAEFPEALTEDASTAFARRLGHLPTWIFHGALDDVVPVHNARRMQAAMQALGGEVRYTEYPQANHNAWDAAYAEPELVPWLLAHRRSDAPGKDAAR